VAYYRQGRATDAEREWLLALAEAPAFIPARLGLAELLLAGGRWDELERVADELGQFPDSRAEALTLLARSHLARKDFKRTRELLNQAVVCDPEAVWPLVILSHALLQEGNDGAEAEQVLRRILAREPNNSEARHNLAILLGGQIPPTSGDP
jgi:tetratricopeptide (TPR) repeat protein